MGDAGVVLLEDSGLSAEVTSSGLDHETAPTREVTVLVTGLIVHPTPVRVAYATAATLVPELIQQHDPDYIMHIGMAGGRDHYTLETMAHRDNYKIKDVDDRDGWKEGEYVWKKEGIPEQLHVGWDEADVLARWEKEVNEVETAMGLVEDEGPFPAWPPIPPHLRRARKSVVRLSRDAGRFLCEFTLMESLSRRRLEEGQRESDGVPEDGRESREGKVAFLHVPGGHLPDDVARGVRVTEAAIKSMVASWEEGFRRSTCGQSKAGMDGGRWDGVVWKA
ncbi:hypothetical protein DV737_g457, partial [Chaetothyriales sp. CBS 132003]